jgi:hypothetical protein
LLVSGAWRLVSGQVYFRRYSASRGGVEGEALAFGSIRLPPTQGTDGKGWPGGGMDYHGSEVELIWEGGGVSGWPQLLLRPPALCLFAACATSYLLPRVPHACSNSRGRGRSCSSSCFVFVPSLFCLTSPLPARARARARQPAYHANCCTCAPLTMPTAAPAHLLPCQLLHLRTSYHANCLPCQLLHLRASCSTLVAPPVTNLSPAPFAIGVWHVGVGTGIAQGHGR